MDESLPAAQLVGRTLVDGWRVLGFSEDAAASAARTDAAFSVGYIVENLNGERAFCKALDFTAALKSKSPADELARLASAYVFERDVLIECGSRSMSRVVRALGHGVVDVDDSPHGPVSYLIFELADCDARDVLDEDPTAPDYAYCLSFVHDCAVAIGQMHRARIFHQDVKPANLLIWNRDKRGKLADLGRSYWGSLDNPYGSLSCPGDTAWAPPELLYGDKEARSDADRELADLFSLGSLVAYMVTSMSWNQMLASRLRLELWPDRWEGTLPEILPYLETAHAEAVDGFRSMVPAALADPVAELVEDMCHPDPVRRGRRRRAGTGFLMERYISRIDYLAKGPGVRADRAIAQS